jgi:hypothetical protein
MGIKSREASRVLESYKNSLQQNSGTKPGVWRCSKLEEKGSTRLHGIMLACANTPGKEHLIRLTSSVLLGLDGERLGHTTLDVGPCGDDLMLGGLFRRNAGGNRDEGNVMIATEEGWNAVSCRICRRGNNAVACDDRTSRVRAVALLVLEG